MYLCRVIYKAAWFVKLQIKLEDLLKLMVCLVTIIYGRKCIIMS